MIAQRETGTISTRARGCHPIQIGDTVSRVEVEEAIGVVEELKRGQLRVGSRWFGRSEVMAFPTPEEIDRRKAETPTGKARLAAMRAGAETE